MPSWTPRQPRLDYGPEDTMRELGTLILQMVSAERAASRQAEEADKDRQFQESQMYIKANLDALDKSREQHWKLREQAATLGLTELTVAKFGDINKTDAFKAYTKEEGNQITSALDSLNQQNFAIEKNIGAYTKGHTIAKNIDYDLSGHVSSDELLTYQENKNKIREEQGLPVQPLDEAFTYGIQAWTMDPGKRLDMALKGLEVAEAEELAKWLPKEMIQKLETGEDSIEHLRAEIAILKTQKEEFDLKKPYLIQKLKDDQSISTATINKMGLDNELLAHNIDVAKYYDDDKMEKQLALLDVQIASGNIAIEDTEFMYDQKVRHDPINTQELNIQNHMENQAAVGVKLLTSISLELDDNVHTPLSNIVTLLQTNPDSDQLADTIDDLKKSDKYVTIRAEIAELYSSVTLSKTEPSLPDYDIFLQKVESIDDLRKDYQAVLGSTRKGVVIKDFLYEYKKSSWASGDEAVLNAIKRGADKLYKDGIISKKERQNIIRGSEWEDTGIFENKKLLEQASSSSQKMRDLRITLNNHLALDTNYSQIQAGPIYEE